ncbi:hypothetical protein [Labedella populi]|uniref:hypothetical protein n=1 Tax=Labedella populi TaxID=2498850 RepID=UPI003C7A1A58
MLDILLRTRYPATGDDPRPWLRAAGQIEVIGLAPDALRDRLAGGRIYPAERIDAALSNYFRLGNLTALRELALLWLADEVDSALKDYRAEHGIDSKREARERVVVTLTGPGMGAPARRSSGSVREVRLAAGQEVAAAGARRAGAVHDAAARAALRCDVELRAGEEHVVEGREGAVRERRHPTEGLHRCAVALTGTEVDVGTAVDQALQESGLGREVVLHRREQRVQGVDVIARFGRRVGAIVDQPIGDGDTRQRVGVLERVHEHRRARTVGPPRLFRLVIGEESALALPGVAEHGGIRHVPVSQVCEEAPTIP